MQAVGSGGTTGWTRGRSAGPERGGGCLGADVRSERLEARGSGRSGGAAPALQAGGEEGGEEGLAAAGRGGVSRGRGPRNRAGRERRARRPSIGRAAPRPRGGSRRPSIGRDRRPIPAGPREEVGAVCAERRRGQLARQPAGLGGTRRLCWTQSDPAAQAPPAPRRRVRASSAPPRGAAPSIPAATPRGQERGNRERDSARPARSSLRRRTAMTHFNKGPSYGLSAEVKNKIASKYDHQAEEDLRNWIEEVTGMSIGTNFQLGLKDGIILCELINKLQPGSVKKVNESSLNWPQLENIGNFIKAIQAYGMKPHDIFEANDLFENGNMTQVQTTLVALAGLAKTKGFHTTIDIGVKYAEKQTRRFDEGKLKAGQSVIGLQMGTNKCASQAGMTAYGTRRHLYDPKMQTDKPFDQTTISLQMGTNKGASQAGMLAPGTRRDIYDQKLTLQPVDNSTISLQMGTNKVASQKGMSVYGLGRQVYDPKYCAAPTEPVIHNGSQGTGTNGSEISDSDYQAEYPDEYHGEYQDDYPRDYQYGDQGIDY